MRSHAQEQLIILAVEKLIVVFFIISALLLLIFILIKIYIIYFKKEDKIDLESFSNKKKISDLNYIKYGYYLGMQLLYAKNSKKRKKILEKINKLNLFDKLEEFYYREFLIEYRIFHFSSIAFLGSKRSRKIAYEILANNKIWEFIPEFALLALLSIALTISTYKELYRFYNYLIRLDKKRYFTLNFLELTFTQVLLGVNSKIISTFLEKYKIFSKSNIITYGFIKALYHIEPNVEIYGTIMKYFHLFSKDSYLVELIYFLGKEWSKKEPAIKEYYFDVEEITIQNQPINNRSVNAA